MIVLVLQKQKISHETSVETSLGAKATPGYSN